MAKAFKQQKGLPDSAETIFERELHLHEQRELARIILITCFGRQNVFAKFEGQTSTQPKHQIKSEFLASSI